jgi:UDP-N-acetyl-D-glucosamine dehydrogenase
MADGAQVDYHDPHVPKVNEEGRWSESVELSEERLASSDAVVILTDHSAFDFGWILRHSKILVDTRNATATLPESRSGSRPERWIVKGGCPED